MSLSRDVWLLFATRILRLFGYGFLSITLVLYLTELGLSEQVIGFLLSLSLLGDVGISLWMTLSADRIGRRRMLLLGALLIVLAGGVLAWTKSLVLLGLTAVIGILSPSGNEIGPFLSIEQAALAQLIPDTQRTKLFAWYNLAGSVATAFGALLSGWLVQFLQTQRQLLPLEAYRVPLLVYAGIGVCLAGLFGQMSTAVEAQTLTTRTFGLHQSQKTVFQLSRLFALDAFAGGLVVQSMIVYWFFLRFGVQPAVLGSIFFAANILAGMSALLAERIAARIGLIRTMVYTHIPSNILLMLVPFMPNLPLAIGVLLVRFSISQMDVPTRQSYVMAVVRPDERSAASGITGIARSIGALISPSISGYFLALPSLIGAPFVLAGGLKIIYDLLLYQSFQALKPPEEQDQPQ